MKFTSSTQLTSLSYSALLFAGLYAPGVVLPAPAQAQIAQTQIAQAQPRLRIAVLDFEFASTGQTWSWWGGGAPSQGVSDLLTNKLVEGDAYTLIERSRIQAVLQEQNLALSGRIDASTAAQVGRILGADAVVIGSVTRYNLNAGSSGVSVLGIGTNRRRDTAEVQLTARLVNTTTSEIIATAQGNGEARQGSGAVSVLGVNVGSDHNNSDELLSNAAQIAVEQLSSELTTKAAAVAALPAAVPNVSALVADVAGGTIIINKGSQDGFRAGMTISIERVTREVKDPATGEVIRTITAPIGQIELTQVDARSSEGRVVSGSGMKVGDRAIAVQ
ncbi:MAG: penicillin-binding protein activator LpoB [Leptolyngbyaceae cyanobacterium CSU_1_4]|nr:penicillin-binding protein activator LpoB [Leptolyngbyaceae cyanobacterium CSU_1_4]